jgi:tetratricopeptide (TPR) repeat protein
MSARSKNRQKPKAGTAPKARPPQAAPPRSDRAKPSIATTPDLDRRLAILACVGLVLGTILVYTPVWLHDFVSYDDPLYVTENFHVKAGLSWQSVQWALTTGAASNWHPLAWISHMLDVQLFGVNAGAHHVTNLFLHIVDSLLLLGVLWRMSGAFGRSAFVAALFAFHPVHVESVAWIAERKDVLSTFFWMLGLWAYVDYVRTGRWRSYALVVVSLALGLMSKPMVVTFPFALLLLDYWPLTRPIERRLLIEKLPLFALVAVSSVVTFLAQSRGGAVSALAALPLPLRLANAVTAYFGYIEKTLWPAGLSVFYPYSREIGVRLAAALVVLLAITAFTITQRSHRYLVVGWLWFLGTLVPVIGLVQVGLQSMADRYTYIPAIGLFVMIAWGVPELLRAVPKPRVTLIGASAAIIVALAIVAHAQVQYWRDSLTLWTHALQVTPGDSHVETALGSVLAEQGKTAEAAALYAAALQSDPQFAEAHNKLGVVLADQHRTADAIPHYEAALRIKPSLPEAHYNLGNALTAQGRFDEAIAQYRDAIRLRPDDPAAHSALGSVLDDQGHVDQAIAEYRQALRINPMFADAHNNLGTALARQGNADGAIAEFLEALRINPNQADAHYNVALMLNTTGRKNEAVQHLREALRLRPTHQGARQALRTITGADSP